MKHYFSKKYTITSLIALMLIFFGVKKAFEYTATPTHEKVCRFTFPNSADPTKPTTIVIQTGEEQLTFEQKGGVVNDASCLNATSVYGVVKVASVDDLKYALQFARDNKMKVISAGQKHSMGGQSMVRNGLVLDMRDFKEITLNKEQQIVTVQSGATWADVQNVLDKEGLSVKAMQSINIFTVGGTLSVNAHGIAHNPGQVAPTVRSMHVMLANGEIVTASPTENTELFRHVIGGYGLFGVILDVDLYVVPNEMYEWKTVYVDYHEFPAHYEKNIKDHNNIGLTFGRISISPTSYLTETAVHTFEKVETEEQIPPLHEDEHTLLNRFVINFSKTGGFGRWLRWTLEKKVVPSKHTCLSRNQAMSQKEVCLISRNQKMYDNMAYLKNRLSNTDILQEYFIPPEHMTEFVDGLRDIVKKNDANLLNVTIRLVTKDTITALPYAKDDRFAFVLYFNQKLNQGDSEIVQKTTADLIDLAIQLGGTYYLPYQLYYSREQLVAAYPEINDFFEAKRVYDPEELFVNAFYEKYVR